MGSAMMKGKSVPVTERARGGPAKSVAELIPGAGKAAFRRFGFIQSSVVSRWREIVGEKYAAVSAPESIRFPQGKKSDGTLNLIVGRAHAPIMQHVIPEILERVNRFFGYSAVARVMLRAGELPAVRAAKAVPLPSPVPAELGDSLREVADPELRAVLASLAQGIANKPAMPVLGKVR